MSACVTHGSSTEPRPSGGGQTRKRAFEMTGTDGDFWEIRLRGPWTLADAIYEVSTPSVWRSPFGPVDFGELKSQEVDSGNLPRKTGSKSRGATEPRLSGSG